MGRQLVLIFARNDIRKYKTIPLNSLADDHLDRGSENWAGSDNGVELAAFATRIHRHRQSGEEASVEAPASKTTI